MSLSCFVRFGAVVLAVGFTADIVTAQPRQGLQPQYLPPPLSNPQGLHFTPGTAYGSGLYSPLGVGLGYSPFGYSAPLGGVGYGSLGYGYGYPSHLYGPYRGSYLNVPALPRIDPTAPRIDSGRYHSMPWSSLDYLTTAPAIPRMPDPTPPWGIRPTMPATHAGANTATLTVNVPEGATVSFDGIASKETGNLRVYTTTLMNPGAEVRVSVKVTTAEYTSTISICLRGGEKATVDLTR